MSDASQQYVQVATTLASADEAQRLATALVERRLAACAQVSGPLTSVYWWQNQVERATEWQCLLKTRSDLYPALEAALLELHPYDTPELLATPVVAGAQKYLTWLDDSLGGKT